MSYLEKEAILKVWWIVFAMQYCKNTLGQEIVSVDDMFQVVPVGYYPMITKNNIEEIFEIACKDCPYGFSTHFRNDLILGYSL